VFFTEIRLKETVFLVRTENATARARTIFRFKNSFFHNQEQEVLCISTIHSHYQEGCPCPFFNIYNITPQTRKAISESAF